MPGGGEGHQQAQPTHLWQVAAYTFMATQPLPSPPRECGPTRTQVTFCRAIMPGGGERLKLTPLNTLLTT